MGYLGTFIFFLVREKKNNNGDYIRKRFLLGFLLFCLFVSVVSSGDLEVRVGRRGEASSGLSRDLRLRWKVRPQRAGLGRAARHRQDCL